MDTGLFSGAVTRIRTGDLILTKKNRVLKIQLKCWNLPPIYPGDQPISISQVSPSASPEGFRLKSFWNFFKAESVSGPSSPSTP